MILWNLTFQYVESGVLNFEKPKLVCVDRQDGTQARETEPVYQGRNRIKEFYKR